MFGYIYGGTLEEQDQILTSLEELLNEMNPNGERQRVFVRIERYLVRDIAQIAIVLPSLQGRDLRFLSLSMPEIIFCSERSGTWYINGEPYSKSLF